MNAPDYRIRFLIKNVYTDPETGHASVILVPQPKWPGGLEELAVTVLDFVQSENGGPDYTFMMVSREELEEHESTLPPKWLDAQYRLEYEVQEENYEMACWLRDEIQRMKDEEMDY